jgi:hypothetical protein
VALDDLDVAADDAAADEADDAADDEEDGGMWEDSGSLLCADERLLRWTWRISSRR